MELIPTLNRTICQTEIARDQEREREREKKQTIYIVIVFPGKNGIFAVLF